MGTIQNVQTAPEPARLAPSGSGRPARMGWWRRFGHESAYVLTSLPIAIVAFGVVLALVASGAGLAVILIGLPLLVAGAMAARGFAFLERMRVGRLPDGDAAHPDYRTAPAGAGRIARFLTPLRDGQSWLDIVWVLVGFVTATVAWTVTLAWWAAALGGTTYYGWERFIPEGSGRVTLADLLGFGPSRGADIAVIEVIGLAAALTLPFVVRIASALHAGTGRLLLSGRAELQQQVRRAEAGRTAGRAAESSSLRRLERDIHDGPQQRLLRISMDLGRASSQLGHDPSLAQVTIDGAMRQTLEAVEELRSLSRGIAPPILIDRGLEAALEEAVTRSAVPTTLTYRAPDALPQHVETAVYFIVAEALSNIAKHSAATRAEVVVERGTGSVTVTVEDDGLGGATTVAGGGLAGLQQRAGATDGSLVVTSPPGGPTLLRAELPCA